MYMDARGSEELYVVVRRCPEASADVWQFERLGGDRACWPAEQALSSVGGLAQASSGPEKNFGAETAVQRVPLSAL